MSLSYAILRMLDSNKPCNMEIIETMDKKEGKFGFTNYAEIWNGRLAMIGFITAIIVEMNTGHGVLKQLGIL
jgi:mRNA deadenylase 3'-5' endonuclease subunit Ccr4